MICSNWAQVTICMRSAETYSSSEGAGGKPLVGRSRVWGPEPAIPTPGPQVRFGPSHRAASTPPSWVEALAWGLQGASPNSAPEASSVDQICVRRARTHVSSAACWALVGVPCASWLCESAAAAEAAAVPATASSICLRGAGTSHTLIDRTSAEDGGQGLFRNQRSSCPVGRIWPERQHRRCHRHRCELLRWIPLGSTQ